MSRVVRGRQHADGTIEEERRQSVKGIFRVHAAKPHPRLPADTDELPDSLTWDPSDIRCIHCERPVNRWDEPCSGDVALIVRDIV